MTTSPITHVAINVAYREDHYVAEVDPDAEYDELLAALVKALRLDAAQRYELELTGAVSLCAGATIRVLNRHG